LQVNVRPTDRPVMNRRVGLRVFGCRRGRWQPSPALFRQTRRVRPSKVRTVATRPTTCPASQYTAQYFNNMSLSGSPTVTRCENWPINHDWGSGQPVGGIRDDQFSVRWTGRAYIEDGTYRFIARADDGIRVWFGGQLIVDAWHDQSPTEYVRELRATSGNYDIRVEYYDSGWGAVAQFRWEGRPTVPPTGMVTARDYAFVMSHWSRRCQ